MKRIKISILILLLSTFAFAEVIDKIVAKVGDEIVLQSELDEQFKYIKSVSEDNTITKLNILNTIIEDKLIIQEAKIQGVEVNDYKLDSEVENYMKNIKTNFKNDDQFYAYLEQNGFSPYEFKEFYREKAYNKKIKNMIIQENIIRKINITDAEIEEYYSLNKNEIKEKPEMEKIGIISRKVEVSETTKKNILKEMNKIIDLLNEGRSFEGLAKEYSECPSSKNGGDLGFFSKGMMVKEFEKAAFKLQEGDISNIVKTKFGYHLIKSEKIKGEEIRVRHILKKLEPTENDFKAEKILANDILEKLNNGENFEKLALKYSEDKNILENSGVLGEFTEANYPTNYAEQLKNMDIGDYSDVIESESDFVILHKIEKVPARKFTFEEIKDELSVKVKDQKTQKLYNEYIKEIKKNNFVEIMLEDK